jgi:hypothetical protein
MDKSRIPHFLAALIDSGGASNFAVINSDRLLCSDVLLSNGLRKAHNKLKCSIFTLLLFYPLEEICI